MQKVVLDTFQTLRASAEEADVSACVADNENEAVHSELFRYCGVVSSRSHCGSCSVLLPHELPLFNTVICTDF
jgi:hypothetical protein